MSSGSFREDWLPESLKVDCRLRRNQRPLASVAINIHCVIFACYIVAVDLHRITIYVATNTQFRP
jgi:hypothetical protein